MTLSMGASLLVRPKLPTIGRDRSVRSEFSKTKKPVALAARKLLLLVLVIHVLGKKKSDITSKTKEDIILCPIIKSIHWKLCIFSSM